MRSRPNAAPSKESCVRLQRLRYNFGCLRICSSEFDIFIIFQSRDIAIVFAQGRLGPHLLSFAFASI